MDSLLELTKKWKLNAPSSNPGSPKNLALEFLPTPMEIDDDDNYVIRPWELMNIPEKPTPRPIIEEPEEAKGPTIVEIADDDIEIVEAVEMRPAPDRRKAPKKKRAKRRIQLNGGCVKILHTGTRIGKKCGHRVFKDGLCRNHYREAVLNNRVFISVN